MQGRDTAQEQFQSHDSVLGQWGIVMRTPHPALHGVVEQLWHSAGKVAYVRDRILPRASSYLLINLGPPQYLILPGTPEVRIPFDDVWFSGLYDGPLDTEAPHGSVLLGVALCSIGAARLLPMPQTELCNRTTPLADLLGQSALELRERLLETRAVTDRLAIAEHWLLQRCVSGRSIHPLVHWATQRLADSGGDLRTGALAREAGVSRKHLAGLFGTQVGLTPKVLARVHRFHRVLDLLRSTERLEWSDVANRCGYYDQSHLIGDFQQFSGFAPREFSRHAMPDPRSIVLR
ncbi:MAG: helix-turn-helix domain-containing protein [Tahibacter sp.]